MQQADIAIVGGGILGLAHAYTAASSGRSVVLFERKQLAAGASVRNFGMIWPIGQAAGANHQLAMRSREVWLSVLNAAGLAYLPTGSLHVVYREDEKAVVEEFAEIGPGLGYDCAWLAPESVAARSRAVRREGLLGGLWSPVELTVDPRAIIARLPGFLSEHLGVVLRYGSTVRAIENGVVETAEERWKVEQAIVCSGDEFGTLYPAALRSSGLTRCKLQMMRTVAQPSGWSLGPSLAAGLTLQFYPSFGACSSLPSLRKRIAEELPEYNRWGIHVLVSETEGHEVTLGDSHEYGQEVDIFDKTQIDELVLKYARGFLALPSFEIGQRWHGVYAKHPELPYIHLTPGPGVAVVTGTGGSGMTLSFGIAERTIDLLGV
jgi:FAD dependent oxidoreductase TIGR03364